MITVTITKDKVVHTQNDSIVFEGENLIDIIHINICKTIGNVNITEFSFLFDYINTSNVGDSIQLNDDSVDSIRDDFLAFEIPVTNELTSLSGKIKYWIRIIDAASSLIAKTAEREITIIDHASITDLIPEQSLTLLDQWQINMDTTNSAAQNAMVVSSDNLSAISVIKTAIDGQVVDISGYTQDALNSKNESKISEDNAMQSETDSTVSAIKSESYAKGNTTSRIGEDTDNSLYYKTLAETAKIDAETAKAGAVIAEQKTAGMTASVTQLAEGSVPTVTKSETVDSYNLDFGIPKGDTGIQGVRGTDGAGFAILGYYPTFLVLQSSITVPTEGMAYGIGSAAPYDIYVYDGITSTWINNGAITVGVAGQSAYAAAQAGGYAGVLADFYADLAAMNGFAAELAAL
jgi:hypothetical protein